jgi:hypothetical protein
MHASVRPSILTTLLALGCGSLTAYYPEGRPPDTGEPGDTDTDTDTDTDSDTDVDTDTDTDPTLSPLEITRVEPRNGSTAGGQAIELQGGPFDASAQVWFGDQRATVQSAGSALLRVTSPAGAAGYVPIRVVTDTHSGRRDDAFQYWPDGQGRNGVLGGFHHYRYIGTYWEGGTTPPPEASASLFFVEPSNFEYWRFYAPSIGSCASEYRTDADIFVYNPDITRFTLRRGTSSALNLFRNTQYAYLYETAGNVASQYANSATWTVESDGGVDWPAFVLDGALSTPASFAITSPAISGSEIARVSRGFRITWGGSGGDYVILRLLRFNTAGTLQEEVSCVVSDTGTFNVPSSAFTGWQANAQLTIVVGRVVTGAGTLPHNRSRSGMVGAQWLIGAAFTQ